MSVTVFKYFVFIGLFYLPTSCFASAATELKNLFYESPGLSIEQRVLGRSCFSVPSSTLGASCNSSHLSTENKEQFRSNAVLDEKFDQVLDTNRQLSSGNPNDLMTFLNTNQSRAGYSYFNSHIWYQNPNGWLVSFTPIKGGLISFVRNPTLTEISTHLVIEKEMSILKGFQFSQESHWDIGVNLRLNEAQFLRNQFLVLDALSEPENYLKIQKITTVFLDPSFRYRFDSDLKSQLSLAIVSLTVNSWGDQDRGLSRSAVEVGYSREYNLLGRKLTQTLHFSTKPDVIRFYDRFSVGGIYEAFVAEDSSGAFSFSLGASHYAIGYLGRIDSLTLGLGFESQSLTPDGIRFATIERFLFEAGLAF